MSYIKYIISLSLFALISPTFAYAASDGGGHETIFQTLLFLVILLFFAKLGGVVEKFGIPSVLGELFAGIILSVYGFLGLQLIDQMRTNEIIIFLSQFGAILLLFQVGLESNIRQMISVGTQSLLVALVGVATPFLLGTFVIGPIFFSDGEFATHLFIGASIVATSVGITATVFKSLGISKSHTAQTVIGAAVIDDILGLLLLAIISAFVSGEGVSLAAITILTIKAFAFLGIAIVSGHLFAERISRFFSNLHTGTGMKLSLVILIALAYAYIATLFGLEPIIGAFAAGLILDAVHFRFFDLPKVAYDLAKLKGHDDQERHTIAHLKHEISHTHVEDMVQSISIIFVPLFFAYTGLQVDVASLLNPNLYLIAIACAILAILSKLIAGFMVKGDLQKKLIIGFAMVPRGEVGLIFLSIGKSLGVLNEEVFSVLLIVIIATTFIAPLALKYICTRQFATDHPASQDKKVKLAFNPLTK